MNDTTQDLVILKLDLAKQALAEAKTFQQTKNIFDIADAAKTYAKRQQLGDDAIAYAHAIKMGALRLLGEMLRETPDAKTGPKPKQLGSHVEPNSVPTLADLGIDKKTSMIAQRLADLPQVIFEQVREGTTTLTKALRDARRANEVNSNAVAWSLESVDQGLRKAINNLISNAPPGSQHDIADLLRRLADELEQAANPELYESVAIARDELDIHDAEPGGYKIFETAEQASTHPGAPTVSASCKSTHQPWYRDLTTRKPGVTAMRRKQVEARLTDIERGKLPTKRTAQTYWSVVWAIKDLPRTSPLGRGAP